MTFADELDQFFSDDKEMLVSDPLRFKTQLGIGKEAYGSLRKRENLRTFVEALSVGGMASTAASSSVVAGTFFTKAGLASGALSSIGLGTAAVTPIGWVLASGVLFGGAYAAASSLLERNKETGLIVVPKYINTPLDVIAAALIELMLPASLKVARSDGRISESERKAIKRFFVDKWGYNPAYVSKKINDLEGKVDELKYEFLADALSNYCDVNADCDRNSIVSSFLLHLEEVAYSNGALERQQLVELTLIRRLLSGEIRYRSDPGWYSRARKKIEDGIEASSAVFSSLSSSTHRRLGGMVPKGAGIASSAWARVSAGVETALSLGSEAGKRISERAKWVVAKSVSSNSHKRKG